MRIRSVFVSSIIIVGVFVGVVPVASTSLAIPLIVTTVRPIALFVQQICQSDCEVISLIPAGVNEHSFELTPKDIVKAKSAKGVVAIGFGFDDRILKPIVSPSPDIIMFKFEGSVQARRWRVTGVSRNDHDHAKHQKGGGHNHSENSIFDPHLWYDPVRLKDAIVPLVEFLGKLNPDAKFRFKANGEKADAELTQLTSEISKQALLWPKKPVLVLHDSLGYWQERFQLRVSAAVEGGIGHELSTHQFGKLVKQSKKDSQISAILTERLDGSTKNLGRELGVDVLLVDFSCSGDKKSYSDWMRSMSQVLVRAGSR
ncbi:MAG: metal ABC transporter substrate-binding protein [Proteobacteria bacterium]|nr:metal ABC transporter substrate-binding protein [Pseudomonadota bacterium]